VPSVTNLVRDTQSCSSQPRTADRVAGNLRRPVRFGYARRSRDALIALAPEQPDLRSRSPCCWCGPISVAELGCGDGGTPMCCSTTQPDRDPRDADVAGIEQLSRS